MITTDCEGGNKGVYLNKDDEVNEPIVDMCGDVDRVHCRETCTSNVIFKVRDAYNGLSPIFLFLSAMGPFTLM